MGSSIEQVVIECKSHTWTKGGNIPSAKMTTWDQAMLYFHLVPQGYKKIFVVKKDLHPSRNISLCRYYLQTHRHLIPQEVEFWEVEEAKSEFKKLYFEHETRA